MFVAAKRIYQLAKEFGHDEKEIIEFLTAQGIKVGNRLSAVSEDAYNLLKAKYAAPPPPPEPEPVHEPKPAPAKSAEPAQVAPAAEGTQTDEQATAPAKKKKKKKKKAPQTEGEEQDGEQAEEQDENPFRIDPVDMDKLPEATQKVYSEAIAAGNAFIRNYKAGMTKKQYKLSKMKLTRETDIWGVLQDLKFEFPDTSASRYWFAVNKLTTRAFKLMNDYGVSHRENLAELRNLMLPFGGKYEPREIFTDEENQRFEEQQRFIFVTFGHGMGLVNDNLYDLKIYAERMKVQYERMNFVEYLTNPEDKLRSSERVPFADLVDAITFSISSVVRRVEFYNQNNERIPRILKNFTEWIDNYAKLKEQGAPVEKLEKYLHLQQKFMDLVEFMAFDNLVFVKKKSRPSPFDMALEQLNTYRDNMDDPDAERNFKYKIRGITNIIYKPKEFIFLYRFAELEAQKDYRPPEEIAAAEAAAKAAEEAAAAEAAAQATNEAAKEEGPAEGTDEA